MPSPDRRLPWAFLAVFIAATIAQSASWKLIGRLAAGSLPLAAIPGLAVITVAYGLLVIGLVRMLRPQRSAPTEPAQEGMR
ncbi:MAG TPA: hypothetical protein VJ206_08270 [bacterium]|nr:hypothetical protein [bacterium]